MPRLKASHQLGTVRVVQGRKVETVAKAVALDMKKCMCANFGFPRRVEVTGLCGQLNRNFKGGWGV